MSVHTEFDNSSLVWVKSEIDDSLLRVRDALQRVTTGNDSDALRHAQIYLHQVYGALTLVELPGLARFCEELEQALGAVARAEVPPQALDQISLGLQEITDYLERLMAGGDNVPLVLLVQFRKLAALRGEQVSGAELFFPQLRMDVPAGLPSKRLAEADFAAFFKQQRARFESGLLRWLQKQPNGMQLMVASLADIAACQQAAIVRSFWWTATALVHGLSTNRTVFDLDTKQILMRLNLQLRRLADGSGKVAERLFRDMLYLLAQMESDSKLASILRQQFALTSLFPSAEDVRVSSEQGAGLQVARTVRDNLRAIKEIWSRIASGQPDRLAQLKHLLLQDSAKIEAMGSDSLTRLWQGLLAAIARYETHAPSESDALEFATGLLLVDNALAVYPAIHDDFLLQVDAILARLQNPDNAPELPQLDSVSREAYEKLLLTQLAQEIRSNLLAVEEVLDGFFRDPENKEALDQIHAPLRQVEGALLMLDRNAAVSLLKECERRIAAYMVPEAATPTQAELEDLAEALSSLGFYVNDLEQGRDNPASLQAVIERLIGEQAAPDESALANAMLEAEPEAPGKAAPAPTPVAAPVEENKPLPVSDAAIDAELLEVYLEEAVEVLASINDHLQVCRDAPHDREALTIIRRGFHTLKGSGRMVGLYQLGEVAWAIEQVMNKWLQAEKPATATLQGLVQDAHDAFCLWVEELKANGTVAVEASALIRAADALRNGLDQAAESPEPASVIEESKSEEIQIGHVSVSATLYALFSEEAGRYLAALKHGVATLAEEQRVEEGFILAAHTLGGIASTAGFRKQGELSYAVEHALQQLGADAGQELPLLTEAVSALDTMLNAIFMRQTPDEAPALVARLDAIKMEVSEGKLGEFESPLVEVAPAGEVNTLAADEFEFSLDLDVQEAPASAPNVPEFDLAAALDDLLLDGEPLQTEALTSAPEELLTPTMDVAPFLEDEASLDLPALLEMDESSIPSLPDAPVLDMAAEQEEQHLDADMPIALDQLPVELEAEPVLTLDVAEEELQAELLAANVELEESQQDVLPAQDEQEAAAQQEPQEELLAPEPAEAEEILSDEQEVFDLGELLALDGDEVDEGAVLLSGADLIEAVESEAAPSVNVSSLLNLEVLAGGDVDTLPLAAVPPSIETLLPVVTGDENVRAQIEADFLDDIDDQLLPIFIEEADELLPKIGRELHALADGLGDAESLKQLKRTLHTVKGSARMSGAMRMGEATHRMESRLEDAGEVVDAALVPQLEGDYDLLMAFFDEVSGRKAPPTAVAAPGASPTTPTPAVQQRLIIGTESDGQTTIRVKSELVDQLVNQAGEVAISRSRIEAEMLSLKGSLTDLTENVARLRTQLREIEIQAESQMQARTKELQSLHGDFDPLEFDRFTRLQELTRFLAESVNDVGNVQQALLKNLDESNAALTAQGRMTRDLQQSLMRVRLVPFGSVSERLYRLARQTGKEVGKKVNLEIKGAAVEIDRGVLEKMISPFEHMLRNAIDHGLEVPEVRAQAGKSDFGEIAVDVRQEGSELVILLKDDGRGLDLSRIHAKAIDKGLVRADQQLSETEIGQLIFEPGLSTASNVTQLSGRGIGMDVVKNEISNLGGRIDLTTVPGQGTTFTIRLPLTLAVTQVLLVRSGERLLALPSVMVEQVQELKQEALARVYDNREQEWMGQRYHFAYFPRLLGDLETAPEQQRYSTVLLLRSGAERMALHIDELVKGQEVVVKPIGPQLSRIPGVVGATVLGTGEIVMILNPLVLLQLAPQIAEVAPAARAMKPENITHEVLKTAPVVMVVDDSLTVRKITGRLLEREGFQVVTAKDGVDGLQNLQEVKPDVMLVDIEMPRMDGFEFTRNVRAHADTRDIPIIMITSRTADKHRNYAFELGVNVFLGKPYQEDELLAHIRHFLAN